MQSAEKAEARKKGPGALRRPRDGYGGLRQIRSSNFSGAEARWDGSEPKWHNLLFEFTGVGWEWVYGFASSRRRLRSGQSNWIKVNQTESNQKAARKGVRVGKNCLWLAGEDGRLRL